MTLAEGHRTTALSKEIRRSGDVVMYELPSGRGYIVTHDRRYNPNSIWFADRKEADLEFTWRGGYGAA